MNSTVRFNRNNGIEDSIINSLIAKNKLQLIHNKCFSEVLVEDKRIPDAGTSRHNTL